MYARLRCGGNLPLSGIRYRRGPPMVRNMRAVLKKASYGTRRIFRSIRCKKQASTVRKRYSVPKTGSCGTRRIFKGPQNSRLHRLWTASCRTGRIFSARNGPRSEVSRHKEEADPFWSTSSRKVIMIYRRHDRYTVNFVSSFVEKREC